MKLKNKLTGEIADLSEGFIRDTYNGNMIQIKPVAISNKEGYVYGSLAELNAEWEDLPEEPKEIYFISNNGQIHEEDGHDRYREARKEIGNYFETEEEAEKAVEKLKAWKRLKDKGFRFGHWITVPEKKCGKVEFKCDDIRLTFDEARKFYDDIILLFGGEDGN